MKLPHRQDQDETEHALWLRASRPKASQVSKLNYQILRELIAVVRENQAPNPQLLASLNEMQKSSNWIKFGPAASPHVFDLTADLSANDEDLLANLSQILTTAPAPAWKSPTPMESEPKAALLRRIQLRRRILEQLERLLQG